MRTTGVVLIVLFGLLFGVWAGVRIVRDISFGIDCTGHIKRAADANTIGLATQEMETVVSFLERESMTSGYTSIIYRAPDEDIGFWYQNLKVSLEELKKVRSDATQLEKSNILIKLRETLLDHGQSVSVTAPRGITVFPNNTLYAFWGLFSLVMCVVGIVIGCAD